MDEEAQQVLEEAIQENPEEVARFVQNAGLLNELLGASQMAFEAADDHVVTSVSNKTATLIESADGLAQDGTPELAGVLGANADEFRSAAEKLVRLEQNGTLDQLGEAGEAVKMATDAADDQVIASLANFAQFEVELLHTMADERIITAVETITSAVGDVCQECEGEDGLPPRAKLGLRALLFGGGPLKDPDVRRGLGYVFEILRAIGKRLEEQKERGK